MMRNGPARLYLLVVRSSHEETLDIDDTLDVVHSHQQLSLFNAYYYERGFLPIHVYDVATSRPLAVLLRPGKTPSGQEVTGHLPRSKSGLASTLVALRDLAAR
jgi:hypothetical protein